ncbi:MAG: DUF4350 domain-containing protein [Chamaesiphon sp.]|nr:DUF4350 domain-containing protein [Chamaesiphon sp.]
MTDFKKLLKQYWQLGLLVLVVIVLITVISAMGGDSRLVGSSYSNAANGYSHWYQMMIDRGVKINRWQKSFPKLAQSPEYEQGVTLLQVQPQLEKLLITNQQQEWVIKGNTLIILGVDAPAEDIPFQQDLESPQGKIRIETSRRFRSNINRNKFLKDADRVAILQDRSGSVIIQFKLAKGRIMIATTPYIAANAYQDFQPNHDLLSELVTKDRQQILVDEYIHGYTDRKPVIDPKTGDVKTDDQSSDNNDTLSYLASTPLIVVFINLLLGILVLAWQQNRRFGKVVIPKPPEVDNSEAYIQALGGVLRQANSSEFVLQNIGKAEQLSWQQKLGLGKERLVESQALITAWENQTQLPTDDLRSVLQLTAEARRLTANELMIWLTKIREIDRQLGLRL